MKSWRKPEAVGQEFAANDYISACVTLKCDFRPGEQLRGAGLLIPESEFEGYGYWPCNHEFTIGEDQLDECLFTNKCEMPNDPPLENPVTAYYWIQSDDGHDFHATSREALENAVRSNKS